MHPLLLAHSENPVAQIRKATVFDPLRVLVSGCIVGQLCGVNGTDNGMGGCLADFLNIQTIEVFSFCPEAETLGVPRTTPDIHGGDGFAALQGAARVLDEQNQDITDEMISGGMAMVSYAKARGVELAVLTDMSGACGSQVISDGSRFLKNRKYQIGVGVASAILLNHGIPIVSQRDYRTLGIIKSFLCNEESLTVGLLDHHETQWYRDYFSPSNFP